MSKILNTDTICGIQTFTDLHNFICREFKLDTFEDGFIINDMIDGININFIFKSSVRSYNIDGYNNIDHLINSFSIDCNVIQVYYTCNYIHTTLDKKLSFYIIIKFNYDKIRGSISALVTGVGSEALSDGFYTKMFDGGIDVDSESDRTKGLYRKWIIDKIIS